MGLRGRINDDDIAAVRERARIEDIIEPYTTLKRAGADSLKGLCPFHEEKSPSFHVTPSKGLYRCFGCGEGGDAITFIQEMEGLSFPDAARKVAGMAGMELREDTTPDPAAEQRNRLYGALDVANRFFQTQLGTPEAAVARFELTKRRFTAQDAADAGCGYAPNDGELVLAHLRERGYSDEELVAAGLARPGRRGGVFAFFRGRLLWPIHDARGRVSGFGARRLSDADPLPGKYVNSPESEVYHKSYLLYGLDQARKAAHRSGRVFVVEGYTDVMAYRADGIAEVVASSGTAFGPTHMEVLQRAIGEDTKIVFCFDSDTAGVKAAARAWSAATGVTNRAYGLRLSGDKDPCDYRLTNGPGALATAAEKAVPLTRMVVEDQIRKTLGDDPGPEEKSRAAAAVGALLAQVPDRVVRDGYTEHAATVLGVPAEVVGGHVEQAVAAATAKAASASISTAAVGEAARSVPDQRSTEAPVPGPDPDGEDEHDPSIRHDVGAPQQLLLLERRVLHRLAGDPTAAAAWGGMFEPSLFNAPVAQAVCAAVAAATASGGPTGLSRQEWGAKLLEHADATASPGLAALLSLPLPEESQETVQGLMSAGLTRLREHQVTGQLNQARTALTQAAGTPDEDQLLQQIVDLNQQLATLRSSDNSDSGPS